jgi:hypothetical protein
MIARFRDRLTYANVVATLALFVALGGTGYAASQITSRNIKNRSIKGVDISKDALGGTEVNESKLKEVPLARSATSATSADISRNADNAVRSQSSASADAAAIATDARALAGQGAGAFEKSTRVTFGSGSAAPAGPPNEQVLLSWPEMGVQVTTSTNQCGGGGGTSFAVKSTKGAGGSTIEFNDAGNAVAGGVAPGATVRRCSSSGADSVNSQISDTTRSLFVDCIRAAGQLRCLGIRSEP